MGGKNSKADTLSYEAKDWQETEKSTLYEVMRNNKGQEANLYHFNIKSQRQLEDQIDIYHRRRSPANWVQVIGAKVQKGGFGFCGHQDAANVLTERIPVTLDNVSRLNKQQANVVLYNALRGYSDISRFIVPSAITNRMIGFTKQGQTKVWVNQNFGMNYPNYYHADAKLNQNQVVSNLVNAVAPRTELPGDYVSALKNSGSFSSALNFIRSNSGVAENILEGNRINVSNFLGGNNVTILNDSTPVVQNVVTSVVQNPVVQPTYGYTSTQQYHQPLVYQPPATQTIVSGYRTPSVHFGYNNPVGTSTYGTSSTLQQGGYQVQGRYTQTAGNKYSFTTAQ